MTTTVAVQFHRSSAPYESGDIAGFPVARAMELVGRGVAQYWPPKAASVVVEAVPDEVDFEAMSRDELIAFGRDTFGLADEVPADVTDEALRAAIKAQAGAPTTPSAPVGDGKTTKPAKTRP